VKILFCGDSTMEGLTPAPGGYTRSPDNVPATVQRLMEGGAICENAAVGGSTSPQWLTGEGGVGPTWDARMATTDALIVVINTGINDAFLPGFSYLDYQWHYGQFAQIARAHGKIPVFMTPNPIDYYPHLNSLWQFQHAMKTVVAPTMNVPVINAWDAIVAACPQWEKQLPDKIHPNPALYRFMGNVAFLGLLPVLPQF
jgi:lysophospholipase L1-like esterase